VLKAHTNRPFWLQTVHALCAVFSSYTEHTGSKVH
jgi:hypothetical protein